VCVTRDAQDRLALLQDVTLKNKSFCKGRSVEHVKSFVDW